MATSQEGTFIPLPDDIENKHACVNVKNNDNQCFKWAVLSSLHSMAKNANRLSKYKPFESDLNFEGMQFPVTLDQIDRFEDQNNLSINVYSLKKTDSDFEILPLRITMKKNDQHINLLQVQHFYVNDAATLKFHYVWIKDLSRLVSSKRRNKKFICQTCLLYFFSKEKLKLHVVQCTATTKPSIPLPISSYSLNEYDRPKVDGLRKTVVTKSEQLKINKLNKRKLFSGNLADSKLSDVTEITNDHLRNNTDIDTDDNTQSSIFSETEPAEQNNQYWYNFDVNKHKKVQQHTKYDTSDDEIETNIKRRKIHDDTSSSDDENELLGEYENSEGIGTVPTTNQNDIDDSESDSSINTNFEQQNSMIDYNQWFDPNILVNRLRNLMNVELMNVTSINEINKIIMELNNSGYIDFQYNKHPLLEKWDDPNCLVEHLRNTMKIKPRRVNLVIEMYMIIQELQKFGYIE